MIIITVGLILIAVLAYVVTCLMVKDDVETRIKRYNEETLWKEGIVDNTLVTKLRNNKKTIVTFGVIAWPLYFLFCVGASLGSDVYNLLLGDNYENRIATWFV